MVQMFVNDTQVHDITIAKHRIYMKKQQSSFYEELTLTHKI